MSVLLSWLQIAILIVAVGVLSGALLSALASTLLMDRIRTIAPRVRFTMLVGLALLPALLGLGILLAVFAPSLLDAAGLVQDHCAAHSHHAFHLCFVHDQPPATSPLILGAAMIVALWVGAGWSQNLGRQRQSNTLEQGLRHIAAYDPDTEIWRVDSDRPVAMTLGLLKPRIYISDRLRDMLSTDQLDAVVAHERAHADHLDALVKYVATLAAELHLPRVAGVLLEEIDIASEQACDAAAADDVGDRLTVAEAILSVERASSAPALPSTALGFAGEVVEARVKGLLEPSWRQLHWSVFFGGASLLLGATLVLYDSVHHVAETILSHVL